MLNLHVVRSLYPSKPTLPLKRRLTSLHFSPLSTELLLKAPMQEHWKMTKSHCWLCKPGNLLAVSSDSGLDDNSANARQRELRQRKALGWSCSRARDETLGLGVVWLSKQAVYVLLQTWDVQKFYVCMNSDIPINLMPPKNSRIHRFCYFDRCVCYLYFIHVLIILSLVWSVLWKSESWLFDELC